MIRGTFIAIILATSTLMAARAEEVPSLQAKLDARNADFTQNGPPESVALFEEGVEKIRAAGITNNVLKEGASAPDFELPSAKGGSVRLTDLLKKGPVVIVWYRGGWCPYCKLQLKAMQDILPQIEERGATLIAISPETPDHSMSTTETNGLAFDVLSDKDNLIATTYGLVNTMDPDVAAKINTFVSLSDYNGNDRNEFPLAATFVVSPDSSIRYAFVDEDYRRRAEPGAVLAALTPAPQE
ncbi:MAG: peroxiredoxin-like family protein [bacterium]